MGWLEDLIGPSPQNGNGFEDWLTPPDFSYALPDFGLIQQGGEQLSHLFTPYQYDAPPVAEDFGGALDIYHGLMTPFGSGKELVDQAAGYLTDNTPFEVQGPNEAGQLLYNLNKEIPLSPAYAMDTLGQISDSETFMNRLGSGAMGMATDPMTYALPQAPGAIFAPGMAEQVYSGMQRGGQEGFADALLGAGGLGLIGLGHANEIKQGFDTLADVTRPGQEGSIRNPFAKPDANVVFHGSPYEFDAFDINKMGTGEGNQAYGSGMYMAEEPRVAGDYARNIANNVRNDPSKIFDPNIPVKGNLYAAEIPPPDQFLNYDANLADQPQVVKNAIPDIIQKAERYEPNLLKAVNDAEAAINSSNFSPEVKDAIDNFRNTGQGIENVKDTFNNYARNMQRSNASPADINAINEINTNLTNAWLAIKPDRPASSLVYPPDADQTYFNTQKLKQGGVKGVKYTDASSRSVQNYGPKDTFYPEDFAGSVMKPGRNKERAIQELRNRLERAPKVGQLGYLDETGVPLERTFKYRVEEAIKHIKNDTYTGANPTSNYVVYDPNDISIIGKSAEPDTRGLSDHVAAMKQKYGPRAWRNKMTDAEVAQFDTLLNEAVKPQALETIPEVIEPDSSDIYNPKPSFESMKGNEFPVKVTFDDGTVHYDVIKGFTPEHALENARENWEGSKIELTTKEAVNRSILEDRIAHEDLMSQLGTRTEDPVIKPNEAIDVTPIKAESVPKAEALPEESGIIPPEPPIFDRNKPPQRAYPEQIPPAEPPKINKPEPPKPEPHQKLEPLSALRSATMKTGENLTHINKEIGERVAAYDKLHEESASKDIYKIRKATQGFDKASEQRIVKFLDGESIVLNPKEHAAATKLRSMLDDVASRAKANEVLVGYRKGYFPRKYADRWEWETSPHAFKDTNLPFGNLEKSRQGNKQNFRRDFKVLEEYANEAERRIAEAVHLGKDLRHVTGDKFVGDRATVTYLNKALGRITGRSNLSGDISTRVSRTLDVGRKITALGDLTFAALYQPAQFTATASQFGFRRAIRGVVQTFKNYGAEKLNATRSGALWPNISHEVSKALGSSGYMHGIPKLDSAMRVHANVTGRLLVEDALRGNSYARKQIESLGLNLRDKNIVDQAGKAIADKTQLRTGTLDMPLWTHSPYGKIASQYSSFAYAHSRLVLDLLKHPVQNLGQIARFAAIGVLAGEGVADLREALKAIIPGKGEDDDVVRRMIEAAAGENFDNKSWAKKLQAATRSKRIDFNNPAWRAVQNLSMIGGAGIFQSIAEKATSGQYWQIPLGPMGSLGVETATALQKDIEKLGKGDYRFKESQKNLISNAPIPLVSGRKLSNYVLPPHDWYLNPDLKINLEDYFKSPTVEAP